MNALFPHGRWLLCPPTFFDVKYVINPWMDTNRGAHSPRAGEQWRNLHHTLIRLGAYVEYIEPQKVNPDLVFTANAGLVKGNKVVLSRFRYEQRQGEEKFNQDWFEKHGYEIVPVQTGAFEGEGDALFVGKTLFCGGEFRSDHKVYEEVTRILDIKKYVLCKLVDPLFYHLDTCFCPLDEKSVMLYPAAFDGESLKRIEQETEIVAVSKDDALKFVCNAVVLGKDIILPAKCDETYKILHDRGFKTHPVELDEFLKGGGSAKCLSLKL